MEKINLHSPCVEKNCGDCCDPVKVDQRNLMNGMKLPKDKDGKDLWTPTGEIIAPVDQMETVRITTFTCNKFDKNSKKCLDYENRPSACKNTSCISDPNGNIDAQHKAQTEVEYIKIKSKK